MAEEADSSGGENSTWTKAESTFNKYEFFFYNPSPSTLQPPLKPPPTPQWSSGYLHIYMYTIKIKLTVLVPFFFLFLREK